MKKFILTFILSLLISQTTIAATNSFKTYTPLSPHSHFRHYHGNNNNYLPALSPSNNIKNRWFNRHLNNDYYNYNYNYPYYNYYPQRQSFFSSIKSFFSPGQMTGYTPSYNSGFDNIPYGYQNIIQSSDEDYFLDDYGYKSGATVKILD